MLLVDVYEELKATGNTPLITFGSLLGAVRNGSMIPFTEDTDIGYVGRLQTIQPLRKALWDKGYHMFFLNIWRVCVAPTHPLASSLYDPSLPLTQSYAVPYVDLYKMKKLRNGNWDVQEMDGSNGRFLPGHVVEPFSQVTINGMPFDTVHDPNFFLMEAYGPDYMTPKQRTEAPMATRLKQNVDTVMVDAPHRIGIQWVFPLGYKSSWKRITLTTSIILVLTGLLVFGLATEMQLMSSVSEVTIVKEEVCSPKTRNASEVEYHSGHRFYSSLKDMDPASPPIFRNTHTVLCNEDVRAQAGFKYCLPIAGRKDTPFCTAADRADLLHARSPKSICYASVLHMMLVSVYEELQATGNTPLIVFGSLLGAVRNGSMIPFTEDIDIGFVESINAREALQQELWNKGYHMFFKGVWRVCVAPTHPLAGRLYDPELPLTRYIGVPYVDLYRMHKLNNDNWDIEELKSKNGRLVPKDKVEPFSQVTINGMPFDTVHDPKYFLTAAYGPNYMTPRPRRSITPANLSAVTKQMVERVDKEKLLTTLKKFSKAPGEA
ncbi:Hypothetical protein PHPALM_8561 [Phytophthora palmivora]|uniref:Uncharacterized protein n=1 Tax=Phytophthora palmivora TaxID=4796 RepID=A0A2P4Y9H8_9STRA|nr:Hypothetical protein PHPALM_8561 [Phytophthora palmivora]